MDRFTCRGSRTDALSESAVSLTDSRSLVSMATDISPTAVRKGVQDFEGESTTGRSQLGILVAYFTTDTYNRSMVPVRRVYNQADHWARDLSRARYAALLGASAAIGVLIVGLLLSQEFYLVQSLTMGVVMFALEFAFGKFQTTEG